MRNHTRAEGDSRQPAATPDRPRDAREQCAEGRRTWLVILARECARRGRNARDRHDEERRENHSNAGVASQALSVPPGVSDGSAAG